MPRKSSSTPISIRTMLWPAPIIKEWFYLEKSIVWKIFKTQLIQAVERHRLKIHAFVLMGNHYHMIVSTHPDYNLGIVIQALQRSVSRMINSESKRINHVFGAHIKASVITNERYYYHVYKYVLRNPVDAGITKDCFFFLTNTPLLTNHSNYR